MTPDVTPRYRPEKLQLMPGAPAGGSLDAVEVGNALKLKYVTLPRLLSFPFGAYCFLFKASILVVLTLQTLHGKRHANPS